MPDQAELTFAQMCDRFAVTPRTLRYYEYIELLSPRKVGRARFYGSRELARMTLILRGRRFGFSLEEIRQWLEIYGARGTRIQYQTFAHYAERQLAELDTQIAALQASRDDLAELRAEALRLVGNMPDDGQPLPECQTEVPAGTER